MKVKDSVGFVTGGNRGLGLPFARDLLKRGAKKVYVGVRDPQGDTLPGSVLVKIDVTNATSVQRRDIVDQQRGNCPRECGRA